MILAFYEQLLGILEEKRKHGICKFTVAIWALIALYEPESVEKLLRSPKYIEKSEDYDIIKEWLGTGLLIR